MANTKKNFKSKNDKFKKIADERIIILFEQAKEMYNFDSKLSDRYVFLARKIAMKLKTKIPSELKRRFCKSCYSYLVPGKNCRVRTNKRRVIYYCLICKNYNRIPFVKEVKLRRSRIKK